MIQTKRFSVELPLMVYRALERLAREKKTSLSTEAAKGVIDRLKEKKKLKNGKRKYL